MLTLLMLLLLMEARGCVVVEVVASVAPVMADIYVVEDIVEDHMVQRVVMEWWCMDETMGYMG